MEGFRGRVDRGHGHCGLLVFVLFLLNLAASAYPVSTGSPLSGSAVGPFVSVAAAGKGQAVVVLGQSAGAGAKFAATELQKDLSALSGADIEIVTDEQIASQPSQESWILIGGPEQNRLVKQAAATGLTGFPA